MKARRARIPSLVNRPLPYLIMPLAGPQGAPNTRFSLSEGMMRATAGSVAPRTHNRYIRDVNNHFLAGYEATYEGITLRICCDEKAYSASTYGNLISGVQYYHRLCGQRPLEDWQKKNLYKWAAGRALLDGKVPNPRGAIGLDQLEQMIDYLDIHYRGPRGRRFTDDHRMYFYASYALAARTSEMSEIRLHHFEKINGGYFFSMERTKDPHLRQRRQGVPLQDDRLVHPIFNDYLDNMFANGNLEDPIAPFWNPREINDMIKIAAKGLGWDMRLHYTEHSIRHGAAVDAAREQNMAIAQARTGHLSRRVTEHYARPNAVRISTHTARRGLARVQTGALRLAMRRGLLGACGGSS